MINYIGVFAVGLIVGTLLGVAVMVYLAFRSEKNRQEDAATGMAIASELAREMKMKLDLYEERESWA